MTVAERKPRNLVADIRDVLTIAQDHICGICGKNIIPFLLANDPLSASIDHVIPLDAGGIDLVGNLFVAHRRCNGEKGNRMPTGCELIWLMAVNSRLSVGPSRW